MINSNVSIANVVGGGELKVKVDLNELFDQLDVKMIEYEPETSPMLKFKIREDSPTIMIFSSGSYFLAGASSIEQATEAYQHMTSKLDKSGVNKMDPYFEIRNIVCKFDFEREFALPNIANTLCSEYCEYNPEDVPGLLCSFPDCTGTFKIFRSGSVLLMGCKNTEEVSDDIDKLVTRLNKIGVNVSNPIADS
jgi:transcription initiation factor TFIID TATA-box-binding protein